MKYTITLALVALFCLTILIACQKQNSIDLVKGGVLEFDKSLTVGQAIDNYTLAKSTTWEAGQAENGRNFVNCTVSLDIEKTPYAGKVDDIIFMFQFIVNKDNTFNLNYCKATVSAPGNAPTEIENNLQECIVTLRDIYNGRTNF